MHEGSRWQCCWEIVACRHSTKRLSGFRVIRFAVTWRPVCEMKGMSRPNLYSAVFPRSWHYTIENKIAHWVNWSYPLYKDMSSCSNIQWSVLSATYLFSLFPFLSPPAFFFFLLFWVCLLLCLFQAQIFSMVSQNRKAYCTCANGWKLDLLLLQALISVSHREQHELQRACLGQRGVRHSFLTSPSPDGLHFGSSVHRDCLTL